MNEIIEVLIATAFGILVGIGVGLLIAKLTKPAPRSEKAEVIIAELDRAEDKRD